MSNEHRKTALFDDTVWLAPVETVDELPASTREDTVCYVKGENAVYRYLSGVWVRDAVKGGPG